MRPQMHIINVPSDAGSIYPGKSRAPGAFRYAGLQDSLAATGWQMVESLALDQGLGDWQPSSRGPNGARNEAGVVAACTRVNEAMRLALEDAVPDPRSCFYLLLSGECLYCPAIMSAYWHYLAKTSPDKRVGLIYMDADCDLSAAADANGTGNIAGMTMTHLTLREGALHSMRQFSRPDESGVIDSSNFVLFGLNMVSPANQRHQLGYLFDNNFRVHTSTAVQKSPVEEARRALAWMDERVDKIIVHLDVDVIDPGEFPLCNVPSQTGLEFDNAMAALKVFLRSEKTVALSLAEVNPDHDPGLHMMKKLIKEVVDGLKRVQ